MDATTSKGLSRAERVMVWIICGATAVAIPLSAWGLIASAIRMFTGPSVRVPGLQVVNSPYPSFLTSSDAPVDAAYESAWVEVANPPTGARWLLWVEGALPAALALGISITVVRLAIALLRGAPFARRLPTRLGAVAIAVIVSGVGTQVIGAIARAEIVAHLGVGQPVGAAAEGLALFGVTLDPSPIGWGLGIALVAAAFSIGSRQQHETRGLA